MVFYRLIIITSTIGFLISSITFINAQDITYHNNDTEPIMNTRLVGAVEAEMNDAPYLAAIMVKSRSRGLIQFCGGAIIRASYVLTAAHCLKLDPHRLHLIAGLHNVNNLLYYTTQRRRCEYYVKHPKFTTIGPFDIGIIRTNMPFRFNEYISSISISMDNDPIGNVLVYGWGSTRQSSKRVFPNRLRVASLTLVTYEYCKESFPTQRIRQESNLCAGLPDYLSSACVGDSGGPAVQREKLIGLVSWGPSDCNSEAGPTILTRLEYYYPWILKNIQLISLQYDGKEEKVQLYEETTNENDTAGDDIEEDNVIDEFLNSLRPDLGNVIMN